MPIEYHGKICEKVDCSNCEKCIFDEDYIEDIVNICDFEIEKSDVTLEDLMKKDMANIYGDNRDNNTLPKSCNVCKYSQCTLISKGSIKNYNNWHCMYNGVKTLLDMSVPSDKDVQIPSYCPLKAIASVNNSKKTNEPIKLNYTEKRSIFDSIKPLMEWDKIEEKTVYHVPPLPTETRKDIYIISKNDYSCTYRILSSSTSTSSGTIYTMYKSTLMHKFLQKHKIKQIEVVNLTSK